MRVNGLLIIPVIQTRPVYRDVCRVRFNWVVLGLNQRGTFLANSSIEALGTLAALTGLPSEAGAAFGLFSLQQPQVNQIPLSSDPRQVALDFDPQNDVEETIFLVNAKHDFEKFSVKFNAGWGNSKIAQLQDFDGGVGPALNAPAFLATGLPAGTPLAPGVNLPIAAGGFPILAQNFFGPGGTIPLSSFNFDDLNGASGGANFGFFDNYTSANLSIGENDYYSFEAIINSNFDGRFNFLLGANYSDSNGFADFAVSTTGLDYFSTIGAGIAARGATFSGGVGQGLSNSASLQAIVEAGVLQQVVAAVPPGTPQSVIDAQVAAAFPGAFSDAVAGLTAVSG